MNSDYPAQEYKGYIGYRIIILFAFIMVAILAGLVYFKMLPSLTDFTSKKVVTQENPELTTQQLEEMNKASESSSTLYSTSITSVPDLKNVLDKVSKVRLSEYTGDRVSVTDDTFVANLPVHDFDSFTKSLSPAPENNEERLVVVKVINSSDPTQAQYIRIFGDEIKSYIGTQGMIQGYETYSQDGSEILKFISLVFYE